jgi:hypothetical protein
MRGRVNRPLFVFVTMKNPFLIRTPAKRPMPRPFSTFGLEVLNHLPGSLTNLRALKFSKDSKHSDEEPTNRSRRHNPSPHQADSRGRILAGADEVKKFSGGSRHAIRRHDHDQANRASPNMSQQTLIARST